MGVAREGFDLFSPIGRKNFRAARRRRWVKSWSLMWRDTFGRFDCMVRGHKSYVQEDGERACCRCNRFLPRGKQDDAHVHP